MKLGPPRIVREHPITTSLAAGTAFAILTVLNGHGAGSESSGRTEASPSSRAYNISCGGVRYMDPVAKGFEADLTKGGYRIAEGPLCVNGLLGFVAYDPKHPACAMRVAENTSQDAWEVYVDERYINRGNTAKPPASQVTALADDARLPHCIVHHPPFPFAEGAPSEVGIAKPRMLTSTIGGMAVTMTPSALSAPGNLPA